MLANTFTVDPETNLVPPMHTRARAPIQVEDDLPPLPKAKASSHRARDPVNLADPLLHAIARAERGQIKALATPEQLLSQMVLRMRLVDPTLR